MKFGASIWVTENWVLVADFRRSCTILKRYKRQNDHLEVLVITGHSTTFITLNSTHSTIV